MSRSCVHFPQAGYPMQVHLLKVPYIFPVANPIKKYVRTSYAHFCLS
jgi:hypothetical protein